MNAFCEDKSGIGSRIVCALGILVLSLVDFVVELCGCQHLEHEHAGQRGGVG
jgi:hypothetical protein